MLRCFLPVGQGGFYLEHFKKLNSDIKIIYDCGTSTKSVNIGKVINSSFEKGEEIYAVFISHLHDDHINGLDFLLQHCNVKNIIFPLTYRSNRCISAIQYLRSSFFNDINDFVYRIITNPYETIRYYSPQTKIYAVDFGNNETYNDEDDFREIQISRERGNLKLIPSGVNVLKSIESNDKGSGLLEWEYIPYNFRVNSRASLFYKEISERLNKEVNSLNIFDVLKNWQDIKTRVALINSYKAVNKDLNANSMTLFSGVKNIHIRQSMVAPEYHRRYCCDISYVSKPSGCLYLGDYNTKGGCRWEQLKKSLQDYWKYIGCVQIPHHGSRYSYNHNLSLMDTYHFISAGKNNSFYHPHASVIRDLFFEGKHPFLVTEDSSTMMVMEVGT